MATVSRNCIGYEITSSNGETILIQSDWDYPGVAANMGWSPCACGRTDGTVDCGVCGRTTEQMIEEAAEWMDAYGDKDHPLLEEYFNTRE